LKYVNKDKIARCNSNKYETKIGQINKINEPILVDKKQKQFIAESKITVYVSPDFHQHDSSKKQCIKNLIL